MTTTPTLRSRAGVLAFAWATTSATGLVLASPFAAITGSLLSHRPEGDGLLWQPGGVFLVEGMRLLVREGAAVRPLAPWLLLALTLVGLAPWGAVLVSLASATRLAPSELAGAVVSRLPPLTLILGAGVVLRVLLAIGGSALVTLGYGLGGTPTGEVAGGAAAAAVVLVALCYVRVLGDLASAAASRPDVKATAALLDALALVARAPIRLLAAWLLRAVPGVAIVAAVAVVVGHVGVATDGRTLLVFLLHQLVLVALVVLRASWLRRAVTETAPRLVDHG